MKSALLSALLITAACATTNPKGPQSGNAKETDDGMVCSEVSDTGSMFSHTECKPREERQAETDAARRAMQSSKTTRDYPTSSSKPAAGGR